MITDNELRKEARERVERAGSQLAYARKVGCAQSRLSDFLAGKCPPPGALLDALGYERVVSVGYRRKAG